MIIAVDVYYSEDRAKAAGVIFSDWKDTEPLGIVSSYTARPPAYEPGFFYRRELPCLEELFRLADMDKIDAIVIDGYVYLDNEQKPGLGHYVYTCFAGAIPVIGVAKTAFHGNEAVVQKVYRGKSRNPLYITSVGIGLPVAAGHIQDMGGMYRIPRLLRLLDAQTRSV